MPHETIYTAFPSPIGDLLLTMSEGALTGIFFPERGVARQPNPDWRKSERPFAAVRSQLKEYFAGRRRDFDVQLALAGTRFQQTVWAELRRIPYGRTISYGELARRVGNPAAARAVGSANGCNPVPIIVPCHRVIAAGGKLGGFGGGLAIKEWLLELESESAAGS